MITVLIVDDDAKKRNETAQAVKNAVGERNLDVRFAVAVADGASALEESKVDLMILDVNLPMRAGEPPRRDGGLRLLRELLRAGPRFNRPTHILGLTAYQDIVVSATDEFDREGWQLVLYSDTEDAWKDTVAKKAIHIAEGARASGVPGFGCGLAILTALKPIELEAVLSLPGNWREEIEEDDDTIYHVGEFQTGADAPVRVVAAAAAEMGMAAAACLGMKISYRFRPKYLALAGIAAGISCNFGDILFADQSWDYGSGKLHTGPKHESLFSPAPNYISVDPALKEKAEHFRVRRKNLISQIQERWQGNPLEQRLAIQIGPVACGAAVIESERVIEAIKAHNRKVIAVEMETYGVFLAGRTVTSPRPLVFAAKSACDFGVPPKTDEHQRYAAFTSANFVYEFAMQELFR